MTPDRSPLEDEIRRRIADTGPMPVADFMALCLGDPEHGYYAHRTPLGADGDFVTAPEVSQMFGELIGLWAAATWEAMGAPDPVRLVELGPGRGTMMADAVRAGRALPAFRKAAHIHLVETSPALRECQRQTLGGDVARALAQCARRGSGGTMHHPRQRVLRRPAGASGRTPKQRLV